MSTLKVTIQLPHGVDSEEVDLAPDSTIEFVRADSARYSVAVDDTLAELALVGKKG